MGEVVRIASFAVKSNPFSELYKDGMTLIEEVAQYLDGAGRQFAKQTDQATAIRFSKCSMELTTTLMQVAAWLLSQRAINAGEQSDDLVRTFDAVGVSLAHDEAFPAVMNALIEQSIRIRDRIATMHQGLYGELIPNATPAE